MPIRLYMTDKISVSAVAKFLRWTRSGLIEVPVGPYDSFEGLAFSEDTAKTLSRIAMGLTSAKEACHNLKLPWRYGCFLFGAPGSGKSAASQSLALLLGWNHLSISESEILDAHYFARALASVPAVAPLVVSIENIDSILTRVDVKDFVDIFDDFNARVQGAVWIATTRRPEETPKNILVRPGRFDEPVRLSYPDRAMRDRYFKTYVYPLIPSIDSLGQDRYQSILDFSEGFSFSHLSEMRYAISSALIRADSADLLDLLISYAQDQSIHLDRWSGVTAQNVQLEERVKLSDPRMLHTALLMTDIIKKIVESTLEAESDLPPPIASQ